MIYLDNGATTLKKPKQVAENMIYALNNFGNPSRGTYPASVDGLKAIHTCREKISDLFHAVDSSRVAFTSNITESLNMCANMLVNEGDRVVATVFEHNSVLRPLYMKKADLRIVGLNEKGVIDYDSMEREIEGGAKAVFCSHASNLTGDMLDIMRIGKLCRKHNAAFVVDAAQTAGVFEINMKECNIDFLCFTGHKSLLGPQGVGGICVREGIEIEPVKVGGSGTNSFSEEHPREMPLALEAGTVNTPGIHGLSAGIDFINEIGLAKIFEHESKLMKMLYSGICENKSITVYGDFSTDLRAPIVAFNVADIDAGIIAEELWERAEIAVRSGAHCAPAMHKALKTKKQGAIRMSLSYFNNENEILKAIETVSDICSEI